MTDPPVATSARPACAACGASHPAGEPWPFACPAAASGDGRDHVLARTLDPAHARFEADGHPQPFVRHRSLLDSHTRAIAAGLSDAAYVSLVESLDQAVARVDGRGFRDTPFAEAPALETPGCRVWVKDDTGNVGGSHKARHLFGLALHLEIAERAGLTTRAETDRRTLAIASCGNAALAAAVVARATERPLRVFIPTDADPKVVERLHALGARIEVCERTAGVPGDPCVHGFHAALAGGALPFCVQGNENGLTIEGGMTIGWEMAAQCARSGVALDRLFVQVGGGALASSVAQAFADAHALGVIPRLPRLHAVQTHGAAPLRRAYVKVRARALAALGEPAPPEGEHVARDAAAAARLAAPSAAAAVREALVHARNHRAEFMWPWESVPHSIAHGILDDETYDWAAIVEGMLVTGGWPLTVDEAQLAHARERARRASASPVDATGAAGLAGLEALAASRGLADGEQLGVLVTGADRS